MGLLWNEKMAVRRTWDCWGRVCDARLARSVDLQLSANYGVPATIRQARRYTAVLLATQPPLHHLRRLSWRNQSEALSDAGFSEWPIWKHPCMGSRRRARSMRPNNFLARHSDHRRQLKIKRRVGHMKGRYGASERRRRHEGGSS